MRDKITAIGERPFASPTRALASRLTLATFLAGAGVAHFLITASYARIVPRQLGNPTAWVYGSGVAEIAAGALLALPQTRRQGAWLAAALLVGVFPANIKMALDGGLRGAGFPLDSAVVAWLRVPLQLPLIWWALRHTGPRTADTDH